MDENNMNDFEVKMNPPKQHSGFRLLVIFLLVTILAVVCVFLHNTYSPDTPADPTGTGIGGIISEPQFSCDDNKSLADVYEDVIDSVVTVKCQVLGGTSFPFGTTDGIGSGFIATEAGHVVTNYHVISAASSISVILNNGKTYSASIAGYKSELDIAVLKIVPEEKLSVACIGDSATARAGDWVFAVGTPHSAELHGTITRGIISYAGRRLSSTDAEYLQIDAAISPGNSGGPLFNLRGEVIGINTSKVTAGNVENIGFSISSKTFKPVVEDIITRLPNVKLGIGITGAAVSDLTSNEGLPKGVLVVSVTDGAPAALAGIEPYDIITEFDGEKIDGVDDITAIIAKHQEGDVISVKVVRESSDKTIELSLVLKSIEFYE